MGERIGEREVDVIVIGAGLGGLLSAAQFLQRGRRVVVVERLAHPGGRFTAKTFQGAQVSTGAVHMLPFGSNGELAGMLRALQVPHHVHDAEVFASFHVRGKEIRVRSLFQLARVFGPRQFAQLIGIAGEMFLRAPRVHERTMTFLDWLEMRASRGRSPEVFGFFERVSHFALSLDIADISYPEVVETAKNMFRYGPPGIVDGGCAALTGELERRVLEAGGEVLLQQDVLGIEQEDGAVTGVRVRNKQTGEEMRLRAPMVISNIGPQATRRLMDNPPATPGAESNGAAPNGVDPQESSANKAQPRREACGLKVHLLSDESIIPHKGIMYCLDTERIAGIVQPSNSDPRLAPPGKHLLITHQLMRSDDVNVEREAARADLRRLFGQDFGVKVKILTMSQYRGEWPVNRTLQGEDVAPETELAGLYLVGDAAKPSGYLMVEGVAQSVNAMLDVLDRVAPASASRQPVAAGMGQAPLNTPAKPSWSRALMWLVAPPPPHPGS